MSLRSRSSPCLSSDLSFSRRFTSFCSKESLVSPRSFCLLPISSSSFLSMLERTERTKFLLSSACEPPALIMRVFSSSRDVTIYMCESLCSFIRLSKSFSIALILSCKALKLRWLSALICSRFDLSSESASLRKAS